MTGSAGIRPNRQWRSRPQGRASSIQPSFAAIYSLAKARISCWSMAGSTPENIYAALPCARNDIAMGLAHADMHSYVSILNSRIAASLDFAKTAFRSAANASPFWVVSSSLRQVEQINTVWCNSLSLTLVMAVVNPLTHQQSTDKTLADDSAHSLLYNTQNFDDRNR